MSRLCLAAVLAVGLLAAHPASAGVSAEDFLRHARYEQARISPSGTYLAVTVPQDDSTVLAIVDVDKLALKSVFAGEKGMHVSSFFWVSDERVIFTTAQKDGSLDFPVPTPDLYAGDIDGRKRVKLLGVVPGAFTVRPFFLIDLLDDDPEHVLVQIYDASRHHVLYKLNVYTGHKVRVARSPVRQGVFLTDAQALPRVAVGSTDKAESVVMYRDDEDAEWREIDRVAFGERGMQPIEFMPDHKHLLAALAGEGGRNRLSRVDPTDGSSEVLAEDETYDLLDGFGRASGLSYVLTARDNRTPVGVAYEGDKPELIYFDREHPDVAIYEGLRAAFAGARLRFGNFTKDGSKLVLKVESDVNPGDFYLYEHDKGEVRWLFAARPWIDPEQMAPMQPIRFKARDGLELRGYLTLPRQRPDGAAPPLVVLPHGGPHGPRDYWSWQGEVQFLAHHGFAVLQVNFRGSGGFGSDFEAAGYKRWGREMQDDLTDATHWAIEQGYGAARRTCIYGGSYGGYAALMGAIREPTLYRCAVGYVGVYDIGLMFEQGDYLRFDERASTEVMRVFHGDDPQDWKQRSPLYNVEAIKVPLLIATGKEDQRVPFAHHQRLIARLDQLGKNYETIVEEKEGHGFFDLENRVAFYERLLAFLNRHTGSEATDSEYADGTPDTE